VVRKVVFNYELLFLRFTFSSISNIGQVFQPSRRRVTCLQIVKIDKIDWNAINDELRFSLVASVKLAPSIVVRISTGMGQTPKRISVFSVKVSSFEMKIEENQTEQVLHKGFLPQRLLPKCRMSPVMRT